MNRLVEFLRQASSYSEATERVECLETHISWVFLTDRHAYKLKKPVRFDFLDFSRPELRREACESELRLNRRLAGDIYLEVLPITQASGGELALGGKGEPVDWVVQMLRLPEKATMEALLTRGELTEEHVALLLNRLLEFYQSAPRAETTAAAYRQALAEHVAGNESSLSSLPPPHDELVKLIFAALVRAQALAGDAFDQRVRDGRIIEGHGDLRPEHIFCVPHPVVIDCIEFSKELRRLDVLDELSFLAMESDRPGVAPVPWIGRQLIGGYAKKSGDDPPAGLVSFYKCYRATVRAKVLHLRARQRKESQPSAALEYLEQAAGSAARLAPPAVVIVRGLMGSGKSTLARRLARLLRLTHLRTDAIRREMFGGSEGERAFNQGRYTEEKREEVYEELFRRAERHLRQGRTVVLDGTFQSRRWLQRAIALAKDCGAEAAIVRCECPAETARSRIAERRRRGDDPSEAEAEFHEMQRRQFEVAPQAAEEFIFDTSREDGPAWQALLVHLRSKLVRL